MYASPAWSRSFLTTSFQLLNFDAVIYLYSLPLHLVLILEAHYLIRPILLTAKCTIHTRRLQVEGIHGSVTSYWLFGFSGFSEI
jgi:hypothetical protein